MRIKLIAFNGRYTHSCLALFYLRNALARHLPAVDTEICQFTINDSYYHTLQEIVARKPDALFFSVYIWNAERVYRLVEDIARLAPTLPVVLGGPQVSYDGPDAPPTGVTVVRGAIEGVGEDFYRDLADGCLRDEYHAVPGAAFSFPYLETDFSGALANRNLYYESSRGCPFSCTYCLSSVERGVLEKDVDTVVQELRMILAHSPKIIRFVDRTFNTGSERTLAIWRFLADHGGETACHFEIAPDRFTEEMFGFLQEIRPGRFQFEIGVQSTHPESLAAVRRNMDIGRAKENIARLATLETVHLHVDLILGLPHETKESFARSFNEVFALAPHHIQMGLLKILPGTAISRAAEEFALLHCARPPYEILGSRWMTPDTVRQLHEFGECFEAFYNTRYFQGFFHWLRKHHPAPFAFFDDLRVFCRQQGFFERSPTQELLSGLLVEATAVRPDSDLLRELLCHDWLRTGHRFLPGHLAPPVSLRQEKDALWHRLPQSLPPLYEHGSRNEFFKRTTFCRFSAATLAVLGYVSGADSACLAFLSEAESGVLGLRRTLVLPD